MDAYRCFAGIALPEAYQRALAGLREGFAGRAHGGLTWTRPGNWHLTLKFLGAVPLAGPSGLKAVTAALGEVVFARFVLAGTGGGFFPGAGRPRVAWVGLGQGGPECARLAGAVEAALAPLGYPREERPFRAHLTVARLRDPGRAGDTTALGRALAGVALPPVTVAAVTLWRSELTPGAARYTALASVAARD